MHEFSKISWPTLISALPPPSVENSWLCQCLLVFQIFNNLWGSKSFHNTSFSQLLCRQMIRYQIVYVLLFISSSLSDRFVFVERRYSQFSSDHRIEKLIFHLHQIPGISSNVGRQPCRIELRVKVQVTLGSSKCILIINTYFEVDCIIADDYRFED